MSPASARSTPSARRSLAPALLALALTTVLAGCATTASAPGAAVPAGDSAQASAKAQRLDALYAQYWEESLKLNPIQATFQGDPRYNDQLPDFGSAEYRAADARLQPALAEDHRGVGPRRPARPGPAELRDLRARRRRSRWKAEQFPAGCMPVNQLGSFASFAVQLGSGTSAQPFKTVKDYDNWLARGDALPALFDTAIANMREGIKAGVVQPRALMVKVMPQLDALIKDKPEDTLFWGPIKNLPADFSDADKQRLTAAYRKHDRRAADAGLPASCAPSSTTNTCPGHARQRRPGQAARRRRPGTRSTRATAPPPT